MKHKSLRPLLFKLMPPILAYSFFLLAIPSFLSFLLPCLKKIPGTSYEYAQCNLDRAMNFYLLLGLGSFALLFALFYLYNRRNWKLVIPTALTMCALLIVGFLLFLPRLEIAIKNAPILIDTIPRPTTK